MIECEKNLLPSMPCHNCSRHGFNCVTALQKGRTWKIPSSNQDLMQKKTPEPSALRPQNLLGHCHAQRNRKNSCDNCAKLKKRCSLEKQKTIPPCDYCLTFGIDCAPKFSNNRRKDTAPGIQEEWTGKEKRATVVEEKNSLKASNSSNSTSRGGIIVTKLAHPINFNHEASDDCNWCQDQYHGLVGLPRLEVKVWDFGDAYGYIEQSGGHIANGHPPSRMCLSCTLDRTKILSCEGHDVQYTEEMLHGVLDQGSALDYLIPGEVDQAPFYWCSICPSAASFRCVTIDELGEIGCGLQLCPYCATRLSTNHAGKLGDLIDKLEAEEAEGDDQFKIRADADFLHPQGELMRRMLALSHDEHQS